MFSLRAPSRHSSFFPLCGLGFLTPIDDRFYSSLVRKKRRKFLFLRLVSLTVTKFTFRPSLPPVLHQYLCIFIAPCIFFSTKAYLLPVGLALFDRTDSLSKASCFHFRCSRRRNKQQKTAEHLLLSPRCSRSVRVGVLAVGVLVALYL